MIIYNSFISDFNSVKIGILKCNCLDFIFDLLEDSHVNNNNLLFKCLETLRLILVYAQNENENLSILLIDLMKRKNIESLLDKLILSKNKDIEKLAMILKESCE